MNRIKMSEELNHNRRRFLRNATLALAGAELAIIDSGEAQSSHTSPAIRPGTNTLFGPLKRDAGVLSIAYAEAGPADGPPVREVRLRPRPFCEDDHSQNTEPALLRWPAERDWRRIQACRHRRN